MNKYKEECINAFNYLAYEVTPINCGKCIPCDECNDRCKDRIEYEKNCDVIEQLIEEHFGQKGHSLEYKQFKLLGDSTLMKLPKFELLNYIKTLYHNWGVADEQCENVKKFAKQLSNYNDELRGGLNGSKGKK